MPAQFNFHYRRVRYKLSFQYFFFFSLLLFARVQERDRDCLFKKQFSIEPWRW